MKLSKKDRRSIQACIEDAKYQIEKMGEGFLSVAEEGRLDMLFALLLRIEEKIRGKRRPARSVQATRGAR